MWPQKPLLKFYEVAEVLNLDRSGVYRLMHRLNELLDGKLLRVSGGKQRKHCKVIRAVLDEAIPMRATGETLTLIERMNGHDAFREEVNAWRQDVDQWRGVMTRSQSEVVQVARRISTMPPR